MAVVTRAGPTIGLVMPPTLRAALFGADEESVLSAGVEVVAFDDPSALASSLPDVDVLVTSWGMPVLTADLLDTAPRLRLVAHIGAAVRPFVTEALFTRGIAVTQAGQGMARPVAEVALTMTLALLHQVHRMDHALRAHGSWSLSEDLPERHEILGSRIGVVGASRTGRAYIELVRALGARVLVTDPYVSPDDAAALGVELSTLPDLMSRSRVVCLHAPTTAETRHLVGAAELALLSDGSGLVNTARSWLVDQDALRVELVRGRIDAALDVFDEEPLPPDHPYLDLPNVLLTPHQAAGTVEGRRRQGSIIAAEVSRFLTGTPLLHDVTRADLHRIA